ncbi:MAG TPA: F0F1 ATP synthase subunit B' [Stellaceae bacterium]|jgi:F-type H+-transporting ATPase subunit b|nr:F0F1 ATP synthase subunit B' [Stellaceae bacterium]
MPQLDPASFIPQLFWLGVTFIVLYILMRWIAVPQVGHVIEARRERLESDLGRAGELRSEAEGVLAAYEKALAMARTEAQATIRQITEKMAAEAAGRQRQLAAALADKIAEAEQRVAASKEAALADIRGIAAEVGGAMVEKLTGAAPDAARIAAAVDGALAARAA